MDPKRLGLLRDLAPGVLLFGALVNPNFPPAVRQLQQLEEAARAINQRLFIAKASTDPELDASFASLKREGAGALLVAADPYFDTRRDRIVGFAAQQRLPAIYQFREYAVAGGLLSYGRINTLALAARLPMMYGVREYVEAGGLMSYGPNFPDLWRHAGDLVDKILRGAKPAEIPVEQPTKFDFCSAYVAFWH
jgi:putative ABC transport system substrate-binding protein